MADAGLIRSLEDGGLSRKAAETLVAAIERQDRQSPNPWMLDYAALTTAVLVGGFAWTATQLNSIDASIIALDAKFANRIDALDAKFASGIDALDAKFATKIDSSAERLTRMETRLTRIETLIEERLPPPQ